jgi:hypothetical protein
MKKLGGGCMPLYSSKNLANNNHGTRKKPNKVHIFLTNSKKCQDKTLVTKQFSSPKQEKEPPRVVHHFTSLDKIKTISQEREIVNFPKRGANFIQVGLSQWESYDQNEIEVILFIQILLKVFFHLILG